MAKPGRKIRRDRIRMPEAPATERRHNFSEVNCGYEVATAGLEAGRCLFCKKPLCIQGCPVGINIPAFIREVLNGNLSEAYTILREANPLPAVCGRVCPQETQCEVKCVVGNKGDPIAIGNLERFVGDWGLKNVDSNFISPPLVGGGRGRGNHQVAIIGSGPAGLACAQDLARAGVQTTIFEALHEAGGVLAYGIPIFRLPRDVVQAEILALKKLGVRFEFNKVIGKIFTIEQLLRERGFDAVFIGTGAGLPKFMGIEGECLNGVMSANEFLTRVNLMRGFEGADTPVGLGKRIAVVGAGNTALDTARTALRMGAEEVMVIYRRTRQECPARHEELRHAEEEGIVFKWLTNPIRLSGNDEGHVTAMECLRMELGDPDESGRRAPHPVGGSEFQIPVDTVVYALGTRANPIIGRSTPGLKTNTAGYIEVDPATQMTSLAGVFAGGDIVTGSATVILALGAGRRAAAGILKFLDLKRQTSQEAIICQTQRTA